MHFGLQTKWKLPALSKKFIKKKENKKKKKEKEIKGRRPVRTVNANHLINYSIPL